MHVENSYEGTVNVTLDMLVETEVNKISNIITKDLKVEVDLRREIRANIKRLDRNMELQMFSSQDESACKRADI